MVEGLLTLLRFFKILEKGGVHVCEKMGEDGDHGVCVWVGLKIQEEVNLK
ncbi:hypothetical protein Hanom_Chr04g00353481 [Helianthus anomalus]